MRSVRQGITTGKYKNTIQVDLGIFTHISAYLNISGHISEAYPYPGISKRNKAYSGICRTLCNCDTVTVTVRAMNFEIPKNSSDFKQIFICSETEAS